MSALTEGIPDQSIPPVNSRPLNNNKVSRDDDVMREVTWAVQYSCMRLYLMLSFLLDELTLYLFCLDWLLWLLFCVIVQYNSY